MARYTTEVRTILKQCWLDRNPDKDLDDLSMISPRDLCETVWDAVFDFPFPMFEGMTKQELCSQILMFYYMREVGLETVPLWKHYLQVRMSGIMPYYVKLAESQITKADALQNRNITERVNRQGGESENKQNTVNTSRTGKEENADETVQTLEQKNEGTQESTYNGTQKDDSKQLYADTPQDGLQAVIEENYLTNATVNDGTSTVNNSSNGTTTNTTNGESITNDNRHKQYEEEGSTIGKDERALDYQENVSRETSGFDGDIVDTVTRYREAILNIPLLIIKDLSDLFISIIA